MKTYTDIKNELKKLPTGLMFFHREELQYLEGIIEEEEQIAGLAYAEKEGDKGLVFLTTQQLIFVYKLFDYQFYSYKVDINRIDKIDMKGNEVKFGIQGGEGIVFKMIEDRGLKAFKNLLIQIPITRVEEEALSPVIKSEPNKIIVEQTPPQSNGGCLGCFGLIAIVFIVLFGIGLLFDEEDTDFNEETESLGVTLNDFQYNYNYLAQQYEIDVRLNSINVKDKEGLVMYDQCLSDYLCILGSINSSQEMEYLMIIGGGANGMIEATNMLVSYPLMIRSVDPRLSRDEAAMIVKELGVLDSGSISNFNRKTTYRGVNYSFYYDDNMGLVLLIGKN